MSTSDSRKTLVATAGAFVAGIAVAALASKAAESYAASSRKAEAAGTSSSSSSGTSSSTSLNIRQPLPAQADGAVSFSLASPAAVGATTDASPRAIAPPSADAKEAPWKVSVGEHGFNLGQTHDTGLRVDELLLLEVPSLRVLNPEADAKIPNHKRGEPSTAHNREGNNAFDGFISFTRDDSVVIGDIVRSGNQASVSRCYLRAGPRASLYFAPNEVRAAIVTCGGLCPGLNNVIRELTNTLWNTYGCRTIHGVRRGYWGFHDPAIVGPEESLKNASCPKEGPMMLTPDVVEDIHHYGGTMLGSDRGGDSAELAVKFLQHYRINQLYVLGGDGTARGADQIFRLTQAMKLPVVVSHVSKTIDNDIGIIDRSFGFDSAVAEAQLAIKTAKVEASGAPNGISVVKLMGRFAGFIAAHASLASGDVDLCLIPELPIVTSGPASILTYLEEVIKRQGHAVVVVAEGAGEEILTREKLLRGEKLETDAGGNRKLPPILSWLKDTITAHFNKPTCSVGKAQVRTIDPSYLIRAVPANPADAILCTLLAQSACHGAMAGYTGFSVGLTNNRCVYLPISTLTANSPRRLNPRGRTYERLLLSTGQPDPLSDPVVAAQWKEWEDASGLSAAKGE